MATPITGNRVTIYQEDVGYKRPVSESLLTKLAQASQYANDNLSIDTRFSFDGYFRLTDVGLYSQLYVVENEIEVNHYHIAIGTTGIGHNSFNITVSNAAGTNLGNLFVTAPNITTSSASIDKAYVGSSNSANLAGVSYHNGTLNPTFATIPAGYTLSPVIVTSAEGAKNATITLNTSRV